MLAIRYVTLAALVVWLGGLVALGLVIAPSSENLQRFHLVGYVCGAIIFVCLIVLKFVGPPPHDFFPRISLVALMLLVAIYANTWASASPFVPMAIDIALGFILLFWYANE
jgi:hypothetical protein